MKKKVTQKQFDHYWSRQVSSCIIKDYTISDPLYQNHRRQAVESIPISDPSELAKYIKSNLFELSEDGLYRHRSNPNNDKSMPSHLDKRQRDRMRKSLQGHHEIPPLIQYRKLPEYSVYIEKRDSGDYRGNFAKFYKKYGPMPEYTSSWQESGWTNDKPEGVTVTKSEKTNSLNYGPGGTIIIKTLPHQDIKDLAGLILYHREPQGIITPHLCYQFDQEDRNSVAEIATSIIKAKGTMTDVTRALEKEITQYYTVNRLNWLMTENEKQRTVGHNAYIINQLTRSIYFQTDIFQSEVRKEQWSEGIIFYTNQSEPPYIGEPISSDHYGKYTGYLVDNGLLAQRGESTDAKTGKVQKIREHHKAAQFKRALAEKEAAAALWGKLNITAEPDQHKLVTEKAQRAKALLEAKAEKRKSLDRSLALGDITTEQHHEEIIFLKYPKDHPFYKWKTDLDRLREEHGDSSEPPYEIAQYHNDNRITTEQARDIAALNHLENGGKAPKYSTTCVPGVPTKPNPIPKRDKSLDVKLSTDLFTEAANAAEIEYQNQYGRKATPATWSERGSGLLRIYDSISYQMIEKTLHDAVQAQPDPSGPRWDKATHLANIFKQLHDWYESDQEELNLTEREYAHGHLSTPEAKIYDSTIKQCREMAFHEYTRNQFTEIIYAVLENREPSITKTSEQALDSD